MGNIIKIEENRFQKVYSKFRLLSKEKQDLENKRYRINDRIRLLERRRDRELNKQRKTHNKASRDYKLKTKIAVEKINSDSMDAYNKIRFKLDPKAIGVITGLLFEKELSRFKNIQKTHIRTLMVARNNYIRITIIKPKKIRIKYNKPLKIEIYKKEKLTNNIYNLSKKNKPYYNVIGFTTNNREKIKRLKKEIRELNKKYKKLEKIKPVWKGMREADEYYDEKEKIQDKFITLDLEKERLEHEINKLAKEANKKLYSIKI